jgi:hypothetical protein
MRVSAFAVIGDRMERTFVAAASEAKAAAQMAVGYS